MGACLLFLVSSALAGRPPAVFREVVGSPFDNGTGVRGVAFRTALSGRVVLALNSNRYYRLDGVRLGAGQRAATAALHTGPMMHVGLNDWYMAVHGSTTAVLKVRDGRVREIGIANVTLTRTHSAQLRFIKSFHL